MSDNIIDKLSLLGLKGQNLDNILKNQELTSILINIINRSTKHNKTKSYSSHLYNLAVLLHNSKIILSDIYLEKLIEFICDGRINRKIRLDEGLKFIDENKDILDGLGLSEEELNNKLDLGLKRACGVGIIISEDDILQKLEELKDNNVINEVTTWTTLNRVMKLVRDDLKWVDGKMVKDISNKFYENLFGKRTKNKSKSNKNNNRENKQENKQEKVLFELGDPKDNFQINKNILTKHLNETNGKVITRFPPEPNGYLHIGHAKAIFINFGYAKRKNGMCILRFDDTNPAKETNEFTKKIIEDVNWLNHEFIKITHTSDYFDQLYNYAEDLIRMNKAYICFQTPDEIHKGRMEMKPSPTRDMDKDQVLELFRKMRAGETKDNEMVLRLKIDMNSLNPNMRDPVAYRVCKDKEHIRTGKKWAIYPTYDYSHCIVDSIENVTHSLCTMEFQTRNEVYKWILDTLELYKPPQIEYSRLNITHCVNSKRNLMKLVDENIVSGWDDPRLPTIRGLRRRGYTPESINDFCSRIGMSIGGAGHIIEYNVLEECLRQDLEESAPRCMAVMEPLRVNILNLEKSIEVFAKNFPNKEQSSTHTLLFSKIIYIDKCDFRINDSKKYKRLAPNKIIRLKYGFPIKCVGYKQDYNQNIIEVDAIYYPTNDIKVDGTINWVGEDHIKVSVNKYNHLFPEKLDTTKDYKSQLNIEGSKKIFENVFVDSSIKNAKPYDKFQFERIGYFSVDLCSSDNKKVFNMITGLKESINKKVLDK